MKSDHILRSTVVLHVIAALASTGCARSAEHVDPDAAVVDDAGADALVVQPPIPELATWEAHMTQWGAMHCPTFSNNALSFDAKLGATYYDAVGVYHQIGFYTND